MILSLKNKLQNKNSFYYMVYKVVKSKIFSSLLLFTAMIIIVRHLSKEDFGLYALLIAFFSFFEVFLGGFDASLVRFINSSGKRVQHYLLASILLIKTIIVFISLIFIYSIYDYSILLLSIPEDKIVLFSSVYIILSINLIVKFLITTFSNLLTAYMLYDFLFKVTIVNGSLVLLSAILVTVLDLGLYEYTLFLTVSNFILTVYYYMSFTSQNKISKRYLLKSFNKYVIIKTFREKILNYSIPLLGVSILSYLKNYLPTFFFGSMVSLETLAVYTVFRKIIDFLHKGYDGILKALYPMLFKIVESKNNVLDRLFWFGLILRIIIFVTLWISYDFILTLYNIEESQYDYLIFIVLISVFFIMYFATFSNIIVLSDKNTNKIFITAFSRTILSIIIIFLLYNLYNILGIIISLYILAIIGISFMMNYANKIIKKNHFVKIYYLCVLVLACLIFINLGE